MKKLPDTVKGLIILLIISIISGTIVGLYLYNQTYNSFKEGFLPTFTEDRVYTKKDILLGEHQIDEYTTINIVDNDTPTFKYHYNDSKLNVTCSIMVFQLGLIFLPSVLVFAFLLLVYIPIVIIDFFQGNNTNGTYLIKNEFLTPPDELFELPKDLSIYSILLLRFKVNTIYLAKKDHEIYLQSILNKYIIDELYDEYYNTPNTPDNFSKIADLKNQIDNLLYEELIQKGYLEYKIPETKINEYSKRFYDETIGYLINKKKLDETDDAIKYNDELQSANTKAVLGTALILIPIIYLLGSLPFLGFVFTFFIIYSWTSNNSFKYTLNGKRLRKKIIEYERKYLIKKNPFDYTPQETLYMSVLRKYPFIK